MSETPAEEQERLESRLQAECAFHSAHYVSEKLETFFGPMLEKSPKTTKREAYIHALFIRAKNWMKSVSKLNGPSDFQPLATASRSLFELAIDMTVLHHDDTGEWTDRMEAWENSARYNHAECIARYYSSRNLKIEEAYDSIPGYLARDKSRIEALRLKYWPIAGKPGKAKHPKQWSHQSLLDAAKYADLKNGSQFELFYETRYRYICMNTHGSTLAGIRNFNEDGLNTVCCQSLNASAEFGMAIVKLALQSLENLWSVPEIRKVHAETDLERQRRLTRVAREKLLRQ